MPKGKKFDAAEKHFQEKEERLQKQIKSYSEQATAAKQEANMLRAENEKLKNDLQQLALLNHQLQKASGMTDEQVKTLVHQTAATERLYSFLDACGAMTGRFYT